jgi:hypothetical protein
MEKLRVRHQTRRAAILPPVITKAFAPGMGVKAFVITGLARRGRNGLSRRSYVIVRLPGTRNAMSTNMKTRPGEHRDSTHPAFISRSATFGHIQPVVGGGLPGLP